MWMLSSAYYANRLRCFLTVRNPKGKGMTIRDVREISFDLPEMKLCLGSDEARSLFSLRPAQASHVELSSSDDCVDVVYHGVDDSPAEVVKCDGPRLAVLMMKWCQEKRIPLPRNARKFLRVTKDAVVLRLEN
jgi:hypothetical protein